MVSYGKSDLLKAHKHLNTLIFSKRRFAMSELLNSIRPRIESLGIGFQFVKTIKTGTDGAECETWLLEEPHC